MKLLSVLSSHLHGLQWRLFQLNECKGISHVLGMLYQICSILLSLLPVNMYILAHHYYYLLNLSRVVLYLSLSPGWKLISIMRIKFNLIFKSGTLTLTIAQACPFISQPSEKSRSHFWIVRYKNSTLQNKARR